MQPSDSVVEHRLDGGRIVTVRTVVTVSKTPQQLKEMLLSARRLPPCDDDPVARIRALRDEWD